MAESHALAATLRAAQAQLRRIAGRADSIACPDGTRDAGTRARALDPLPGLSHTPDSPLRAYLLGIKPAGISNAEWFIWIGLDERKEKR
jgi:hypothetical protein